MKTTTNYIFPEMKNLVSCAWSADSNKIIHAAHPTLTRHITWTESIRVNISVHLHFNCLYSFCSFFAFLRHSDDFFCVILPSVSSIFSVEVSMKWNFLCFDFRLLWNLKYFMSLIHLLKTATILNSNWESLRIIVCGNYCDNSSHLSLSRENTNTKWLHSMCAVGRKTEYVANPSPKIQFYPQKCQKKIQESSLCQKSKHLKFPQCTISILGNVGSKGQIQQWHLVPIRHTWYTHLFFQ